jgi:polyhydroxyalkanoate synthase
MSRNYLMGEREPMSDLMAWNADTTRLPYRMHSEYLRRLFLDNDLAEDRYVVGSKPVSLADIKVPIFAVGTVSDHVAPWRSTYKIHRLVETEVTYLLTTGGHNAGIVSEPDHRARSFQVATAVPNASHIDPDTWLMTAPRKNGSWWPEWSAWLKARSGAPGSPPAFPATDTRLAAAPGIYVLQA